jgi:protein-tyrosine phosphatase
MDLISIDNGDRLFISPAIDDWQAIYNHGITAIIDMDGGVDENIPTTPDRVLYVYFPITDGYLPDLSKLHAVALMGASLVRSGHKVLSHCGLGFNRSALVAGLILIQLGMTGEEAVAQLREKRPGALFNDKFAEYLQSYSALS